MNSSTSAQDRTARLGIGEKVGYGLGDAGFNFYWIIIGSYLSYFYTDIFGLAPAAAGTMFLVTKIIDAFTDPAMGAIADRTNTRFGKFRPWVLFGAVPMAASAVLTMSTPDLGEGGKLIWAYVSYSSMMLCYTILSTPYSSLSGVLTGDTGERNQIFGIRFFFAYGTGIFVGAATPDLAAYFGGGDAAKGWQYTMMFYSSIATVLFLITFLSTKERIQPSRKQETNVKQDILDLCSSRPWVILFALAMILMVTFTLRNGSASYYFKYFVERPDLMGQYIGLQMLCYMIGASCTPFLTRFMDKAKLLIVLMGILGAFSLVFAFIPKPDTVGVVTISDNSEITLNAEALLGEPHSQGDQYQWSVHKKVYWIISKKEALLDEDGVNTTNHGESVLIKGHHGSVISVNRISTDGKILDSSNWPIEIVLMFLLNILISLALGPKAPLTWSMYADAADYNEWRTGRRATAMTFSAATFSQKMGGAIAGAGMLYLLSYLDYVANEDQAGSSLLGIVLVQTVIPGFFAFIAIFALRFYDLTGAKLDQIQLDLKNRQAESEK